MRVPVGRWWRSLQFAAACLATCACGGSPGIVVVRDGEPEAAILVDPAAPADVLAGVDILRRYVREISGADLPVVHERAGGGPWIVVEVGAGADPAPRVADLGEDGFRIRTTGGDLVFTAKTAGGFRNAVYTFLETRLGCRKYSVTVEEIPRRATIAIPPLDDTQVPPLTFRMQDIRDEAYAAWHKLDTQAGFGLFVHTFEKLVPPERWFELHPEYFSMLEGERTPKGQLCLTNPDVFRIVVAELRARIEQNPGATVWSVSQNDTYVPCACPSCRALDDAAGSHSGSILQFVNRIAAEFPDKIVSTLAYQYSRPAPGGVAPAPNVQVMLCSIECNRSRPIAEDPGSASFKKDLEDWARLTPNIFLWDYVIQFRNLVSPFPNLRVLQPNLRFFVENGVTAVFEQGLPVMYGEFAELRTYLISKLLWDPYADVDVIIDDFLRGFYGEAAPFLRGYIDAMHDALEASGEGLDIFGYPAASEDGYLSPARMDAYEQLFVQAEAVVQDDPETLARVRTAHLPLQFARLEQAKVAGAGERGCFVRGEGGALRTRPEIEALLDLFVRRCEAAGIPRLWERGTAPDEYQAATRRFFEESTRPHLALLRPVALAIPASPKYHAGDPGLLSDGYRGWDDYHQHWLGFEGEDMTATVDLGEVQPISTIATSFLQDINSWIFMPLRVSFSVSDDGSRYRTVGSVQNATPPDREGAVVAPFEVAFPATRARYVRVEATSRGTCPVWHKGSGLPSWIFADEIAVR